MTTQNIEDEAKTHTLRVFDGGNAQLCLLSLSCLTILGVGDHIPRITFWIGNSEREAFDIPLIITAYKIISAPYNVAMRAIYAPKQRDMGILVKDDKDEQEFVFTNYNTGGRKGWIQIPKCHLPLILDCMGRMRTRR